MASSQPTSGNLDFGRVLEFKMDDKCFDEIMSTLRTKDAALDAQKATLDALKADLDTREADVQRREVAVFERERSLIARESGGSIVSPRGLTNTLLQSSELISPVVANQSATSNFTTSSLADATATVAGAHNMRDLDAADTLLALSDTVDATFPAAQSGIRYTPSHIPVDIPEGSIHIDTAPQSIQGPQAHSRPLHERLFVYLGAPLLDHIDSQPEAGQTTEDLEKLAVETVHVNHYMSTWWKATHAGDEHGAAMALFEASKYKAGFELYKRNLRARLSSGAVPVPSQQVTDEQLKASLRRAQEEAAALGFATEIGTDSTEDSANEFEEESDGAGVEDDVGTEEGVGGVSILAEAVSSNISQLLRDDASDDSKDERMKWSE